MYFCFIRFLDSTCLHDLLPAPLKFRLYDAVLKTLLFAVSRVMLEFIVTVAMQNFDVVTHSLIPCICACIGHSMANLSEGESGIGAGARFITHLFNAMLPVSILTLLLHCLIALSEVYRMPYLTSVDFTSLNKFKQSILHVDFNDHLMCFKC